jgi:hypothetical protein
VVGDVEVTEDVESIVEVVVESTINVDVESILDVDGVSGVIGFGGVLLMQTFLPAYAMFGRFVQLR